LGFNFRLFRYLFGGGLFIVSFSVLFFRYFYWGSGHDYFRFLVILGLFILSIFILIYHSGIFSLFLGWDGLGITSYLLVLYYINWSSTAGALITVLTNRVGDVCLFLFFRGFLFFSAVGGLIFSYIPFLLLGAFTKRAQSPFRRWLPLAMRAPTPVSSLVHSSTLVAAGVFLLIKYFSFLSAAGILSFILLFGLLTRFVAGLSALVEKDIKKLVALRTLSQLGFLVLGLGASLPLLAFFHLLTHAFFKSCIFLQVGSFILLGSSGQDGRGFRGAGWGAPYRVLFISLCILSLCGLLFTRGFVSKDFILGSFWGPGGRTFSLLILLVICFTFIYSGRLFLGSLGLGGGSLFRLFSGFSMFFRTFPLLSFGLFGGFIINSNFIFSPCLVGFLEK